MKNYVTVNLMVEKDTAAEVIAALDAASKKLMDRAYEVSGRNRFSSYLEPDRKSFTELVVIAQQIEHLQDTIAAIQAVTEEPVTEDDIPFAP